MRLPDPPLLLVTDRRQARMPLIEVVAAALAAGCRWVSVREKDLPEDEQITLVRMLLPIARRNGARLTLHGDAALAKAAGADGVHLSAGSDAAAAATARARQADRRLDPHRDRGGGGRSGHRRLRDRRPRLRDREQARLRAGDRPQRPRRSGKSARVPLVAIGGLNATRAAEVLAAGVSGIAVMGRIMRAPIPSRR